MRRVFVLFALLAAALGLVACGGSSDESAEEAWKKEVVREASSFQVKRALLDAELHHDKKPEQIRTTLRAFGEELQGLAKQIELIEAPEECEHLSGQIAGFLENTGKAATQLGSGISRSAIEELATAIEGEEAAMRKVLEKVDRSGC